MTAGLALLSGCNNTSQQRRLAEQGVAKLQSAWNREDCASIYDEGDGYFRRNQRRDEWLRRCAELRNDLGLWRGYQVADGVTWPIGKIGIVWVEGRADFANGPQTVRADFQLNKNTARLFHFQIKFADGKLVQIPGFAGRLVD